MKTANTVLCLALAAELSIGAQEKSGSDAAASAIPVAVLSTTNRVNFMTEVLPILTKSCLACHNASTAKGELVLETPASILKGGENGPVAVPGQGTNSLMIKLASRQQKPFMPPRDNKANAPALTSSELGLIKLWIDQGATGTVSLALGPVKWQPLPLGLNPINAVAVTRDGQYAAAARGNQVFLYRTTSGELITRLTDPNLTGDVAAGGAADRDLIQSLAFSSDGTLVAAGGYRAVKIWRQQPFAPDSITKTQGVIQAVAASPDGKWIAAAELDGRISVWDSAARISVREYKGDWGRVTDLKFAPDNRRILAGAEDKSARIWDREQAEPLEVITNASPVTAVAWLGQPDLVALGSTDGMVRVWKSGGTNGPPVPVKELKGHTQSVSSLTVSTSGAELLSSSADGTLRQWDVEKGKETAKFDHGSPVLAAAIRPDGKVYGSAGTNGVVKLWDKSNGKVLAELRGNKLGLEAVALAEREAAFAKSEAAFQKTVLDKAKTEEKGETDALKKATDAKTAAEKAYAEKQDGSKKAGETKSLAEKTLAAASAAAKISAQNREISEKLAGVLDTESKTIASRAAKSGAEAEKAVERKNAAYQFALELGAKVQAIREKAKLAEAAAAKEPNNPVLQQGKTLIAEFLAQQQAAAETAIDRAAEWKSAVEEAQQAKTTWAALNQEISERVKVAAETRTAADKAVKDLSAQEKEAKDKLAAAEKSATDAGQALTKAEGAKSIADQNFLATTAALKTAHDAVTAAEGKVSKADAEQTKLETAVAAAKKSSSASEKALRRIAFLPDGKKVATAGDDKLLQTWNAATGQICDVFTNHSAPILTFAVLPGGTIWSSAADGRVLVARTERTWKLERVLGTGDEASPLVDRVLTVGFSPDGKWLATGGGNPSRSGEIKIWDVAAGKLLQDFKDPHSDTVFSVDFTSDGKFLASGAADKFVKVFEAPVGKFVRSFEGHTGHVLGVSWARHGRTLASAGADKVIKVWDFIHAEQKKTIEGFTKEVTSIHFLDGRNEFLAAAGDSQVRLIREDGGNVRTFKCDNDFVQSAAVSADGKVVVAGGDDSILRVWDGSNGNVLHTLGPPVESKAVAGTKAQQ